MKAQTHFIILRIDCTNRHKHKMQSIRIILECLYFIVDVLLGKTNTFLSDLLLCKVRSYQIDHYAMIEKWLSCIPKIMNQITINQDN